MKSFFVASTLVVFSAVSAAAVALHQSGPTAAPAPVVTDRVSLFDRRDLEGGILMETTVRGLEQVLRSSDGAQVRPVFVGVNFTYGLVLLQNHTYLNLHATTDTQPIQFSIAGLDPNLAVRQRPPFEIMNFHIQLTPKAGRTWGSVRGAADVDFAVTRTP